MANQNFNRRRLGFDLRVPVIQAPMAGSGINTVELAAAVCNAGGLGCLAAAYCTVDAVRDAILKLRRLTDQPFAVNLFAPGCNQELAGDVAAQIDFLTPIYRRMGLEPPQLPERPSDPFQDYLEVLLSASIPIVSFTFGILPADAISQLHAQGTYLIGTATSVEEARMLETAGVDAIVAQGAEAGGHRGTFAHADPALVGTIALVPEIADAVRVPVIASGGIMDGRGVVAALVLGASAVQMGTAFLTTKESGAPECYKQAVLSAAENATGLTRAFSGRWARGIRNRFMQESEGSGAAPLSFPWQNALTTQMRKAAAQKGDAGLLSLWAGQGSPMSRSISAAELVHQLEAEIKAAAGCLRDLL
jgi:nitronate monooxygenase